GRRDRDRPTNEPIHYRFRFTSSCSISSDVVMTRELAWKPRWVTIMLVNSWDRSTLDISREPGAMMPRGPEPGAPMRASPELGVGSNMVPPTLASPPGLLNTATAICPRSSMAPLVNTPRTMPALSMVNVSRLPATRPSWPVTSALLGRAYWVSMEKSTVMLRGAAPPPGDQQIGRA